MKKLNLKSKILLAALLLGSGVAVASTISNLPAVDDPLYFWSEELPAATVEEARNHFGCSSGSVICAYGIALDQNNEDQTLMKSN